MKKVILMTALTLVAGCATHSDIQNLQSQVDVLKLSVARISSDAANVKGGTPPIKYPAIPGLIK
jgi:outer membrane murein-binding lipoprotein Lpp